MKNTKRYHHRIAGRLTPAIRQAIRPQLREFARTQELPFNLVFGAVTFVAEQLPGRVTRAKVLALLTPATLAAYAREQARIAQARQEQIRGMARRALPERRRDPATVAQLVAQVQDFKGSIPALNARLHQLAA